MAQITATKLQSQTRGSNPRLKAPIPDSKLQYQLWDSNPSLKGPTPAPWLQPQHHGSNSTLMAPIPSLALGLKSRFNTPILAKHRSSAPTGPLPLSPSHLTFTNLGATGTADHLTLLRLFFIYAVIFCFIRESTNCPSVF